MAFVPKEEFKQYEITVPAEPEKLPFDVIGTGITLEKGDLLSPNYKKSVVGWKLDAQGNAEFQNVTANLSRRISSSGSQVSVSGTTAETNIFSYTLNGKILSTANVIRHRIWVNKIRTTGAQTYTFQCYYGSANLTSPIASSGNITAYVSGYLDFYIFAAGTTTSQNLVANYWAGTNQEVNNGSVTEVRSYQRSSASVDSVLDQTVKVTVQFSSAAGGNDATFDGYLADLSM